MYEDKTLVCRDCGQEFIFTAGEQEFFAEKGFENEPTRCKDCRNKRRRQPREHVEYPVRCSDCGRETTVPFVPKDPNKPIYCDECFKKHQTR